MLLGGSRYSLLMAKRPQKPPLPVIQKRLRRFYLGAWLKYLGHRQADLARATGLTESYISNLVNQQKEGPTPEVLLGISEALDITVNDLYSPPPTLEAAEAIREMTPAEQAALARALERLSAKKSGR